MKSNFPYTEWYFVHFATEGFASVDDFVRVVGNRPSPNFSLTRMNVRSIKAKGEPLTRDNFVWTTKAAIAAAQAGKLAPPIFPADTRTPEEQHINNIRFQQLAQPLIDFHDRQKQKRDKIDKWQSDLSILMDNITSYVTERGYDARDAMNPEVLPPDSYPKLNAARKAAQTLMRYIDNPKLEKQHQQLRVLNERNRTERRKKAEAADPLAAANRVYTGKRGRPVEKVIQKKVRISTLTTQQKVNLGIPPDQDYYTIDTPRRRNQKVWTVMVNVPNPKYLSQNHQAHHSQHPENQPQII